MDLNVMALSDVDFEVDTFFAIPEPGAFALFALGLCATSSLLRRRGES